jgi:N-acetylmuramoyl-L-alanine amidase
MTPRAIVLHTVGVRGDTTADAIREYHTKTHGWRDIGYHFVVRKDGTVEPGRPLDQTGAHTAGANDTWGVCVAGDGDSEPWTQAQWRAVLALVAELRRRAGPRPLPVLGHREAAGRPGAPRRLAGATPTTKTCPGRLVDLDEVRAEVARHADAVAAVR